MVVHQLQNVQEHLLLDVLRQSLQDLPTLDLPVHQRRQSLQCLGQQAQHHYQQHVVRLEGIGRSRILMTTTHVKLFSICSSVLLQLGPSYVFS